MCIIVKNKNLSKLKSTGIFEFFFVLAMKQLYLCVSCEKKIIVPVQLCVLSTGLVQISPTASTICTSFPQLFPTTPQGEDCNGRVSPDTDCDPCRKPDHCKPDPCRPEPGCRPDNRHRHDFRCGIDTSIEREDSKDEVEE